MSMLKEFCGFSVEEADQPIWRAGGPNSSATATSANVAVTSLALTPGETYEVEGAIGYSPGRARALAVVQDLARVSRQLTPPIFPEVLYERMPPPVRCLRLLRVPVLQATDEEAVERLGLYRDEASSHLIDQTESFRRAVRGLRADGWTGAVALPGFAPGMQTVVIPRHYLAKQQVRVDEWNDGLRYPIPIPLIDFCLGLTPDFPSAAEVGGLPVIRRAGKVTTHSWQPASTEARV